MLKQQACVRNYTCSICRDWERPQTASSNLWWRGTFRTPTGQRGREWAEQVWLYRDVSEISSYSFQTKLFCLTWKGCLGPHPQPGTVISKTLQALLSSWCCSFWNWPPKILKCASRWWKGCERPLLHSKQQRKGWVSRLSGQTSRKFPRTRSSCGPAKTAKWIVGRHRCRSSTRWPSA